MRNLWNIGALRTGEGTCSLSPSEKVCEGEEEEDSLQKGV